MDRLAIGWGLILLKIILVLGAVAALGTFYFFDGLQQPTNPQTIILDNRQVIPRAEASLRIVVQKPENGLPVEVSRWPEQAEMLSLFASQTDDCNNQPVTFSLPADIASDQPLSLVVQTEAPISRPTSDSPDDSQPPLQVLLTTDQPSYQPGQTIRLRALVLHQIDQTPATGLTVNFLVTDPQGYHLWQQTTITSDFGVAAIDFKLPDMVHQGRYTLRLQVVGQAVTSATRPVILAEVEQIIEVQTDMPAHAG